MIANVSGLSKNAQASPKKKKSAENLPNISQMSFCSHLFLSVIALRRTRSLTDFSTSKSINDLAWAQSNGSANFRLASLERQDR